MKNLSIYQSREMASQYFLSKKYYVGKLKESYKYPRLVLTNDDRLGWAVYYEIKVRKEVNGKMKTVTERITRISFSKGNDEVARISFSEGNDKVARTNKVSTWFKKIELDSYFSHDGEIWLYKTDKTTLRHWIIYQKVVPCAKIVEQLYITDAPYLPYKAIDKQSGEIVNCYWIAEKNSKMQDMQAVFRERDTNLNPIRHELQQMHLWNIADFGHEKWHMIEERGHLVFCKYVPL